MAIGKNDSVGRPPKWKSHEELAELIQKYWDDCEYSGKPLTMSGLAYALDVDRRTLLNYGRKEEFFLTIQKAKDRVQLYAEECLYDPARKNNVGIIFAMKNNFAWVDKQELDLNGKMEYSIKLPEELEEEEPENGADS